MPALRDEESADDREAQAYYGRTEETSDAESSTEKARAKARSAAGSANSVGGWTASSARH
jgi:hypothetical protein